MPGPAVAIVADAHPARGGIATFAEMLATEDVLNDRFEIELVNTTRSARWRGGALTIRNLRRALTDVVRVFRAARRSDVIHLQSPLLPILPLLRTAALCTAARLGGAAVACHIHTGQANRGPHESFSPGLVVRLLLHPLRLCDIVLTVSDAGTAGLKPYLGRTPIRRVDNAVNTSVNRATHDGAGPPIVIYIGALGRSKGLLDLLTAAVSLRERDISPWELRVVGGSNQQGSDESNAVRHAYTRAGFGDCLIGETDASGVGRELRAASVFVLPSHSEGMPLALLEAMACGLPVIATRVGAIPDVVRDGVDGLLVDPQSPGQLADALRSLLTDETTRRHMGDAASRRVMTQYSIERLREELTGIYRVLSHTDEAGALSRRE